ncbi:hypothetical protein MXB_3890 [Myxobolus squamalis]|nr:hypothetical protein MXB_3890 [Myxobolus squamalis]
MSYTCDDFKFYQSFPGQGDVFSLSGLVVSLLLILLASLSIYSLSNIQGLTRFENQNEFVYFGNTIN